MAASMALEAHNSDEKLTRKARKRKAYEASPAGKARRARQHHLASQKRLAESIASKSIPVTAPNSYGLLPKSCNGASGSRSQSLKDEIDLLRNNPTFRLALLKAFRAIPYMQVPYNAIMRTQLIAADPYRPRGVVCVFRDDKALVAVRTFHHSAMDATYMVDFMQCVDKLATSCQIKEPGYRHQRGNFAQIRIGWNHGMGEGDNVSWLLMLSFSRLRSNASPRYHIAWVFILIINSILMNFLGRRRFNLQCESCCHSSRLAMS